MDIYKIGAKRGAKKSNNNNKQSKGKPPKAVSWEKNKATNEEQAIIQAEEEKRNKLYIWFKKPRANPTYQRRANDKMNEITGKMRKKKEKDF